MSRLVEPYLILGGVELANAMRTDTYLRRGLGGSEFAVTPASPLAGEGVGYRNEYTELYEAEAFWPGNLACYCGVIAAGTYLGPADDPAPWYDATRPESADFLGVVPEVTLLPVLGRSVIARSSGGGTVGAQRLRPRIVQVSGHMYAASAAGMAWGERWLTHALTGQLEGCVDDELTLLPACPPDDADDPEGYLRTLASVGLVDGPVFGPESAVPECHVQSVSFQLAAGHPHLRRAPVACVTEQYLRADPTACCVIEPDGAIGDAATRITIRAGILGHTVSGITITGTPYIGACPAVGDPTVSYTVAHLGRGTELVIDASTRSVQVTDAGTGEVVGAHDSLSFDGLFGWLEAAQGAPMCVCIDASAASLNAGTLLTVEQIDREL